MIRQKDSRWPAWGAAIGLTLAVPAYQLAFRAETLWSAMALLLASGALLLLYYGPAVGLIQNLLPARMRASGVALYSLFYTLIGSGLGPVFVGAASDHFGGRAYRGNFALDCPHGLPADGASALQAAACNAASAQGLSTALSLSVLVLLASAFCFLMAAPGVRARSEAARAQTSA